MAIILSIVYSLACAQYELNKKTINNGGGKMTGGNYEMNASIGQADANNSQTGGDYSLNGGFWHKLDITPQPELMFKDGFE